MHFSIRFVWYFQENIVASAFFTLAAVFF